MIKILYDNWTENLMIPILKNHALLVEGKQQGECLQVWCVKLCFKHFTKCLPHVWYSCFISKMAIIFCLWYYNIPNRRAIWLITIYACTCISAISLNKLLTNYQSGTVLLLQSKLSIIMYLLFEGGHVHV